MAACAPLTVSQMVRNGVTAKPAASARRPHYLACGSHGTPALLSMEDQIDEVATNSGWFEFFLHVASIAS